MMDALWTIARILHPWPWHDYEILAVAAAVVLLFILGNWALDRFLDRLNRTQVQRELRARSEGYVDPAVWPERYPTLVRGSIRRPDLSRPNARGVPAPTADRLARVSENYDYQTGVTRPGPQARLTWMDIERLR